MWSKCKTNNSARAKTKDQLFIENLDLMIAFHSTNTNDPYNIGNSVMVALSEVKTAYIIAMDGRNVLIPK